MKYTAHRPLALLLAAAASLALTPTARADGDPAAAAAFEAQARERARARDFAAALRLLQRAHAADPVPKYVANQGIAYMEMGQYAEAVERFEWFLANVEDLDDQALAESFLMKLRPQVIIISRPPGAEVLIDQKPRGQTPLITDLLAGEHLLELRKDGYEPTHRAVVVELATGQNIELDLVAAPEPLVMPSGSSLEVVTTPPPPPPPRDSGWGLAEWGWTTMAAGALVGGGGAVAGVLALGAADDRDTTMSLSRWRSSHRDAERWATVYYTAAGVAGAAVLAGLVMVLLDEPGPTVRVGPSGAGVGVAF